MKGMKYALLFFLVGATFPILILATESVFLYRKIKYALLFFLVGVSFPVLIWAVHGVALYHRIKHALLFFLVGATFPILIWYALGVALYQWLGEKTRREIRTVDEILANAGLSIQWATPGREVMAREYFTKRPMSEMQELLTRAGL